MQATEGNEENEGQQTEQKPPSVFPKPVFIPAVPDRLNPACCRASPFVLFVSFRKELSGCG